MTAFRIVTLTAVMALLAGCNADERAHVVKLEKGVYRGAADTQLSDATREALTARVQSQRFGADLHQSLRPTQIQAPGLEGAPVAVTGRAAGQNY